MIHSKKIRDSARGEDCTIEIPGVCMNEVETVVLCHFPDEYGGTSIKSDDTSAGYGCYRCHRVVDGVDENDEFLQNKDFYLRRSQTRTVRRMIEKGVLKL